MKNNLSIQIKGKPWEIKFVTEKQYKKAHPDRKELEAALTEDHCRTIWIVKECITVRVVRHELLHAYFVESNTNDSNLDREQTEELACNLIGEHLDDIMTLSNLIIDFYLREV